MEIILNKYAGNSTFYSEENAPTLSFEFNLGQDEWHLCTIKKLPQPILYSRRPGCRPLRCL